MKHREKLVPMIVGLPMFLQNVDSTIMATALPTIAQSLHVDTLRLNLAITAYLISLAIFLPASGWMAERFGARRVFCAAIALFSAASGLSGLATSLEMLVVCRALQGIGGAMMLPVGRLIMLRSIAPAAIVAATVWYTVPPAVGRLIGPFVGGATITWVSWRWIFLINVPLGIFAILLAFFLLDADKPVKAPPSFDGIGFLLLALGLATFLAALEGIASNLMPGSIALALAAFGITCLGAYWWHSRRAASPLIELGILKYQTYFTTLVGGIPLRLAMGAVPFLLPLMFQLGFGLSPLDSGLLTMGTAVGALATRLVLTRILRRTGFRPLLLGATISSSLCYFLYAFFTGSTPHALIFVALVVGGLLLSLVMIALQTLAYTEISNPMMSHATTLSTVCQQLFFSLGVLMAVELLRLSVWWREGNPAELQTTDFSMAFMAISASVLLALILFIRLPANVGSEFRGT